MKKQTMKEIYRNRYEYFKPFIMQMYVDKELISGGCLQIMLGLKSDFAFAISKMFFDELEQGLLVLPKKTIPELVKRRIVLCPHCNKKHQVKI